MAIIEPVTKSCSDKPDALEEWPAFIHDKVAGWMSNHLTDFVGSGYETSTYKEMRAWGREQTSVAAIDLLKRLGAELRLPFSYTESEVKPLGPNYNFSHRTTCHLVLTGEGLRVQKLYYVGNEIIEEATRTRDFLVSDAGRFKADEVAFIDSVRDHLSFLFELALERGVLEYSETPTT